MIGLGLRERTLRIRRRCPALGLLALQASAFAAAPRTGNELPGANLWKDGGDALVGRPLRLDLPALRARLSAGGVVALPMPDGSFQTFRIEESPVMEPALAAKLPEIRTWRAQGIDDPTASGRLDVTPMGFHAYILREEGSFYVDPVRGDAGNYVSALRDALAAAAGPRLLRCQTVTEPAHADSLRRLLTGRTPLASGQTLRTYRIAIAATAEYTQYQGGSISAALSAITTTLNRVNAVYERELAVHLTLVSGDDQLIFTNPADEPYTNSDTSQLVLQNQSVVDTRIGSGNYDIGHVFSTANGGFAPGKACIPAVKAMGTSGHPAPTGDGFDVDFVAHEIGHQLGANHVFNAGSATTGSCTAEARHSATAVEPGSGSTIMGYAGICESANLQPHSNDYFNVVSIGEIVAYTTGPGDVCAAKSSTGNTAPTVDAGANYSVPAGTPFAVTATGSDPDGDALTFCWEELDVGNASPPYGDDGGRPIFRSFQPSSSFSRLFPKLSDILSNTESFGESMPVTTRSMTFGVTARDNRAGGGGVTLAQTSINVVSSAGPFRVTLPHAASSWSEATKYVVQWDVANTAAAPVNCPSVNISLSRDGGTSFSETLASGVPNSGSAQILSPSVATEMARVKVACANNVFFNISVGNFSLQLGAPTADFTFPSGIVSGQSVRFTDASTGLPTSYDWNFGDGTPHSSFPSPAHVFAAAGSYQVALTVQNSIGSDTKTQTVVVGIGTTPPVASFTYLPASPLAGQNIVFTDTSTGSPTSWSWSFGDSTTSTTQNPTKSYTLAGSYQVSLMVTNAGGSSTKTQTVTVTSPPTGAPVADFTWSPNPAVVGQPVLFTDTSIGAPTSWSWTFGDRATSNSRNPTHTYASPGQFDVNLKAANAQGSSPRKEKTITVLPAVTVVTKVLPIVLDVAGTAHYGTEITLANRGTSPASLSMTYTAATSLGGTGSGTVGETLDPLRQIIIPDGIAYLRSKGLAIPTGSGQGGTLRIVFSGVSSPDVAYAGARTTAPAGNGRAGFGYAGVRPEDGLTGKAFLFGLRENETDRSNLALVNLSPTESMSLRVTLVSGAGDGQTAVLPDVSLAPLQWRQLNRVLSGQPFTSGYATIEIVSGAGPYFVYGVFNDNATNDGSYVLPVRDGAASELQLLPVLVETGTFQSELVLTNPFSQAATVTLSYVESISPSAGAGGVAAESLKALEQKIIPNALQYLRDKGVAIGPPGGGYAGSLGVVFTRGGVTSYGFAGARTAAPGDGGQYGFFGRAIGISESASTEAWVFGLQQNALNRSNVAVCNVGDAGTGEGVSFTAEVYDGDTGRLVYTSDPLDPFHLAPGGWMQFSSALAPLGVTNGFVRFIRVSGNDHILAYGVVNDGATPSSGATNDGSYIPFSNR